MKFYIDTADIDEIREANKRGWVDGVTTNPSLVAKTGKKNARDKWCRTVPSRSG